MEQFVFILLAIFIFTYNGSASGSDCKTTKLGLEYRGNIAKTKSGVTCLPWSTRGPHAMKYGNTPEKHPNSGLVKNYCRNPSKYDKGPWCYTKDKGTSWSEVSYEACAVPLCLPGATQSCDLDLGFILDQSGSIKKAGFNDEIQFVKDVAKQFVISSTRTRVSVMTFSNSPSMKIYFRDKSAQSSNLLDDALGKIAYRGGGTYTDKALDLARKDMFSGSYGARANIPKVLILLSDGKSQSGMAKVTASADKLKNSKVNIFSIGVGKDIGKKELEAIAVAPIKTHVLQVSGATALSTIVNTVKTQSCKVDSCKYVECVSYSWGPWNKICGTTARTRTLIQSWGIKKQIGGCAGISTSTTCRIPKEENRTVETAGACMGKESQTAECHCGWKTILTVIGGTVCVLLLLMLLLGLVYTYGSKPCCKSNNCLIEEEKMKEKKHQGKESDKLI